MVTGNLLEIFFSSSGGYQGVSGVPPLVSSDKSSWPRYILWHGWLTGPSGAVLCSRPESDTDRPLSNSSTEIMSRGGPAGSEEHHLFTVAVWVAMFVSEETRRTVESTTTTAKFRQVMNTLIGHNIENFTQKSTKRILDGTAEEDANQLPGQLCACHACPMQSESPSCHSAQKGCLFQPCCSFWLEGTVNQITWCPFFTVFHSLARCVGSFISGRRVWPRSSLHGNSGKRKRSPRSSKALSQSSVRTHVCARQKATLCASCGQCGSTSVGAPHL